MKRFALLALIGMAIYVVPATADGISNPGSPIINTLITQGQHVDIHYAGGGEEKGHVTKVESILFSLKPDNGDPERVIPFAAVKYFLPL